MGLIDLSSGSVMMTGMETLWTALDEQLAIMRQYGQTDVVLVATGLTSGQVEWASANGVEARESRIATPGLCYLVNREGIDLGIDGEV